jgi:hypothetical protein
LRYISNDADRSALNTHTSRCSKGCTSTMLPSCGRSPINLSANDVKWLISDISALAKIGFTIALACFQIGPSEKILGPKKGDCALSLSGSLALILKGESRYLLHVSRLSGVDQRLATPDFFKSSAVLLELGLVELEESSRLHCLRSETYHVGT